jgi:CheY-like chemotaxis protein
MSRGANAAPPSKNLAPEAEAASRLAPATGQVPRVLCVDDEPAMLAVLQRTLGAQFEVVTELDPLAALELVQHGRFSVVISDMKMPGMLGSAFLERVKVLSPSSTRIALTAGLDWQLPPDIAFGILTKPCPVSLLQATVSAAAQFHALTVGGAAPPELRASGAVPLADSVLRPRRPQPRAELSESGSDSGAAASSPVAARARRLAVVVLGARVELWPRATLLGSAMDCDIVTIDPRIAPRQLRFFSSWRGVTVQDVSGRGNVRLNGERLVEVRFVEPGDRIDLGPFDVTVEAFDASRESKKP